MKNTHAPIPNHPGGAFAPWILAANANVCYSRARRGMQFRILFGEFIHSPRSRKGAEKETECQVAPEGVVGVCQKHLEPVRLAWGIRLKLCVTFLKPHR